ncbi:MAG: YihY/virulence factor BrkB family protein [Planctomycetota bacterium]
MSGEEQHTDSSGSGPIARLISRITRERDEIRRLVRVTRLTLRGLGRSKLPQMAAALSYRTIFAIIPVLLVSGIFLQQFVVSQDQLREELERVLNYFGFDTIVVDTGDEAAITADLDAAGDTAVALDSAITAADPTVVGPTPPGSTSVGSVRLDELLAQLVEQASNIPLSAIGFVGILVLVYAAVSMLVELERGFNQIYHAPAGRPWTKRVPIYVTTLVLGLVLLLAAFSVGQVIAGSIDWGPLSGFTQVGINLAINTGLFLLAYTIMPNARVHIRAAFAGAAIAAVAWEIAKWGFTRYVGFSTTNFERLYGVVALLPLFLIWVYLTWVIVLFGLQISYALQHFRAFIASAELDGGPRLIDPAAALVVATAVAERFERGQATTPQHAARAAGIDGRSAEVLLEALAERGLLRLGRDDQDGRDESYLLACPAESIQAIEVLKAGESLCGSTELDDASPVLRAMADARRNALDGLSLRDLGVARLEGRAERKRLPDPADADPGADPEPQTGLELG